MSQSVFMNYSQIQAQEQTYSAVGWNFPFSSYFSLFIPTKRWSVSAYVQFVSPLQHTYHGPYKIYTPDLWWALQAEGGRLLFYAKTEVLSFAQNMALKNVEISFEEGTDRVSEKEQLLVQIESFMNQVVEAFFAEQPAEQEVRYQLNQALLSYIPLPLHSWYQALAPDFFAWLSV